MTVSRIERLALAYPDQIERIKECINEHYGHKPVWVNRMMNDPCTPNEMNDPSKLLADAFIWSLTTEGHEHWHSVANR